MRVAIVDGYNDEPGGLGVPPYVDVYPRLIAGSIWLVDKTARVDYITVDQFRRNEDLLARRMHGYDIVVFIAGVVVPGKYIGGTPARPVELARWARSIEGPLKILVGPAARWGMGFEGGKPAYPPRYFTDSGFDILVRGDLEEYFYDLARHGPEKANPYRLRRDYRLYEEAARLGSRIVRQHPRLGWGLIAEIETYRGCARWVSGGCSFCVEPLRGRPIQRDPRDIVNEVEALYRWGVRAFRLGRQADILVYGSEELAGAEWPKPNPEALRRIFHGIRTVSPGLEVLHIDNVNPGTIARHPEESLEALKIIVEYHTDGDVAAMGVETADPRVAEANNLNTTPEEALYAIELVNKIGQRRGPSGLPHLLPGINFILGLPGETSETYRLNRLFLEELLRRNLLVRRVNIRRLLPLPSTRVSRMKHGIRGRREKHARSFVHWVRSFFDREMLRRIAPRGTLLRGLWVEECSGAGYCYARQTGSYPLTVMIPCRSLYRHEFLDRVVVTGVHSARSLEGLPVPVAPGSRRKVLAKARELGIVRGGPWSRLC
ncbi:MAG: radical SAM protein [Desulfurococcales archaeon]|nr:radical SAM protein [Desulfurococcales archaeon]